MKDKHILQENKEGNQNYGRKGKFSDMNNQLESKNSNKTRAYENQSRRNDTTGIRRNQKERKDWQRSKVE